jgi:Lar family restriction alleviation protein
MRRSLHSASRQRWRGSEHEINVSANEANRGLYPKRRHYTGATQWHAGGEDGFKRAREGDHTPHGVYQDSVPISGARVCEGHVGDGVCACGEGDAGEATLQSEARWIAGVLGREAAMTVTDAAEIAIGAAPPPKRCPFCGSYDARTEKRGVIHIVLCFNVDCEAEGPVGNTEREAVEKWNKAKRM